MIRLLREFVSSGSVETRTNLYTCEEDYDSGLHTEGAGSMRVEVLTHPSVGDVVGRLRELRRHLSEG